MWCLYLLCLLDSLLYLMICSFPALAVARRLHGTIPSNSSKPEIACNYRGFRRFLCNRQAFTFYSHSIGNQRLCRYLVCMYISKPLYLYTLYLLYPFTRIFLVIFWSKTRTEHRFTIDQLQLLIASSRVLPSFQLKMTDAFLPPATSWNSLVIIDIIHHIMPFFKSDA